MKKLPPHLGELIDACRPGSDDVSLPEMHPLADAMTHSPDVAQVYEKSQRLDAAIARAMQDAPEPPAGFEQRLLARLGVDPAGPPATSDSVAPGAERVNPQPSDAPDDKPAPQPLASVRHPRSHDLPVRIAAAVAAVAAVALLVVWLAGRSPAPIGADELVQLTDQWRSRLSQSGWQTGAAPLKEFPLTRTVPVRSVDRWQTVSLLRPQAVACAYELTVADGGRAILFVLPDAADRFRLNSVPPAAPLSTQGQSIAAWTSNDLVFVLLFEGRDRYNRIIHRPATALLIRMVGATRAA